MKTSSAIAFLLTATTAWAAEPPKPATPVPIPAPVIKTLQGQLDGAQIAGVDIEKQGGEKTYEFQIVKNGRSSGMSIAEDGRLLSKQVTFDETPPAVQRKITEHIGKATLIGIGKMLEKGDDRYEVGLSLEGKERSLTINSKGWLVGKEVFLEETPAPVQKTIRDQVGKGELLGIDETPEEDDIAFEVEANVNGKTRNFTVGRDGAMLNSEIDFATLPAAVQKAANANRGQNTIGPVNAQFSGSEVTYEIEMISEATKRTVTFDPAGDLISIEVGLTETPPAIQKAILGHLRGGEIENIEKVVEGGAVSYEVEIGGNRTGDFTVDQNGVVVKERVNFALINAAAQLEIKKIVGPGFVLRVDQTLAPGGNAATSYIVHSRKDYQDLDFRLALDGKYLGMDD